MSDLHSPLARSGPGRPPEDLDHLLSRFFRAQMPNPWPPAPTVQPAAARLPAQLRFRPSSRLALAAAVALFVIGYLSLAQKFPAGSAPAGPSLRPEIGHNDGLPHRLPAKMPNRVAPGKLQGSSDMELLRPEIAPMRGGGAAKSWGAQTQGPRRTIYLNVERIR